MNVKLDIRAIIPIPPIKEQVRVVSKIEELFILLDNISEQLA